MTDYSQEKWYTGLSLNLQPLMDTTMKLLEREKNRPGEFEDYQFIVFPLAKAFEAFLKDWLYQQNLIEERVYRSKKFSMGRSLNPDVRLEQRDEFWFYDDLLQTCGEHTARFVWETWLERNRLFHLYPGEEYKLSLNEAEALVQQFIRAIDLCLFCVSEKK
ncbi:MAG: hypothetical protein Q4G02_00250 [bacterium]|nr:hypothetical protein [bacterium]